MRSRFVRPAVAASACVLLISASVGVAGAAFADDLIPIPVPTVSVTVPPIDTPVGSTGGVTVTVPPVSTAPDPGPTTAPTAPAGTPEGSGAAAGSSSGNGAAGSGAASSTTTDPGTTASAAKGATSAARSSKSSTSTAARGANDPVLGPPVEGTTLFSDSSSPLGILAGSSPARTVMSNAIGIAMLGGLGAVLLVVIGLRLAVLRRRSRA